MKILTDEAMEILEKVKIPCYVEFTLHEPKPSRWRSFLYRLLGYHMEVVVVIKEDTGIKTLTDKILANVGHWSCFAGDEITVYGLYTGTEIVMLGKEVT